MGASYGVREEAPLNMRGSVIPYRVVAIDDRTAESVRRLLGDPVVDYTHVRDTEAGCYDFRIERNNGDNGQRKETNSARMDSNG